MDTKTSSKTASAIGNLIFYGLAIALFLWTASNTLAFIGRALPTHPYAKWLGLAFFDVGAVAWLIVYMKIAQVGAQRGIALLMTFFDLLGAGLMVFGELTYSSGFEIVEVQKIATWSIGIWTIINLVAIFGYHIADQSTRFSLAIREVHDDIKDGAIQDVKNRANEIKAEAASQLGKKMLTDVLADLGVTHSQYNQLSGGKIIEHEPKESSHKSTSKRFSLHNFLNQSGNGTKEYADETDNGLESKNQ